MVGMRAQSGVAHVAQHLAGDQILGQRTGAVEMCLHAGVKRGKPTLQHVSLLGRKVDYQHTAVCKQRVRAIGRSVHTMTLELRARHRSGNELTRSLTGTHAVERLERQHGTQTQRIAAKDGSHGVIHHEQRTCLASRAAQSAKVRHTQTKPADGVDEPPQVRTLGIKQSIKALRRSGKRCNRGLPHHNHVAGIKAARKRFGKVVRKGHQAIAGLHNPQQRQRRRHMRGSNKTRLTRTSPCGPGLF